MVATADPLSPEQRARRERLGRQVATLRAAAGGDRDLTLALQSDPELRRLLDAYEAIPELPRLSLLMRPGP